MSPATEVLGIAIYLGEPLSFSILLPSIPSLCVCHDLRSVMIIYSPLTSLPHRSDIITTTAQQQSVNASNKDNKASRANTNKELSTTCSKRQNHERAEQRWLLGWLVGACSKEEGEERKWLPSPSLGFRRRSMRRLGSLSPFVLPQIL